MTLEILTIPQPVARDRAERRIRIQALLRFTPVPASGTAIQALLRLTPVRASGTATRFLLRFTPVRASGTAIPGSRLRDRYSVRVSGTAIHRAALAVK